MQGRGPRKDRDFSRLGVAGLLPLAVDGRPAAWTMNAVRAMPIANVVTVVVLSLRRYFIVVALEQRQMP